MIASLRGDDVSSQGQEHGQDTGNRNQFVDNPQLLGWSTYEGPCRRNKSDGSGRNSSLRLSQGSNSQECKTEVCETLSLICSVTYRVCFSTPVTPREYPDQKLDVVLNC